HALRLRRGEAGDDLRRGVRAAVVDDHDLVEKRRDGFERALGEILLVPQPHDRRQPRLLPRAVEVLWLKRRLLDDLHHAGIISRTSRSKSNAARGISRLTKPARPR